MPEVTVANTQAVETVSPPTFNHSTEEQHNEFRHILLLLRLATAYNYGESMLPDQDYANHFDAAADRMYRQFTRQGVLNALATIFVRDNEVIATTEVPFLTGVLTTVASGPETPSLSAAAIRKVAVIKNPEGADSDETCADVVDTGMRLQLGQDMSVKSFFKET
jgi:hypothetical protein